MTTNRHHGNRYQETRDLDIAQIAKLVRADIKQAQTDGLIPSAPVKYSVKIDRYSMGQSLDITVKHADFPVYEMATDWSGYERRQFTGQASAIKATLDAILAAYNYDGSDPMTDYYDVRFYGRADFCWQTTPEAIRREEARI